jgi:hypothetical protein
MIQIRILAADVKTGKEKWNYIVSTATLGRTQIVDLPMSHTDSKCKVIFETVGAALILATAVPSNALSKDTSMVCDVRDVPLLTSRTVPMAYCRTVPEATVLAIFPSPASSNKMKGTSSAGTLTSAVLLLQTQMNFLRQMASQAPSQQSGSPAAAPPSSLATSTTTSDHRRL